MILVDSQKILNELCLELSNIKILSIDTEFERKNTYFAKLSLIQISTHKHKIIIDVLANLDLSNLAKLLSDPNILKIFHAPREDFEIFYHLFKKIPINIFDIQIAAQICGLGKCLNYAFICKQILGITIDKTYQKSDWMERPIIKDMMSYAMNDVIFLEKIYNHFNSIMIKNNLLENYNDEIKHLLNLDNYNHNIFNVWKKVKFNKNIKNIENKIIMISAYREEVAMKLNIPRKHFFNDQDLLLLCKFLPTNDVELKKIKLNYINNILFSNYKNQLFDLCEGMKIII
jgi:ribonuclease D